MVGVGAGWGNHSRNVSGTSSTHAPLLPPPPLPAVTISSPSPMLSSIWTTAAPVRSRKVRLLLELGEAAVGVGRRRIRWRGLRIGLSGPWLGREMDLETFFNSSSSFLFVCLFV
jgi:hypothetical protein